MNARLFEYLLSQPWAVRPELLQVALSVVQRDQPLSPELVRAKRGERMDGTSSSSVRNGVGIVPVIGPIFRYADSFDALCGGATVDAIARDLAVAVADPSVNAILLEIDSPGGQANGIAELASHIRDAAQAKPVVAYVGGDGCSAAYWLASAASEIVISSTAILGSIGVVSVYPTPKADGKTVEFVSSVSPNKRPNVTTEKGRAQIQQHADDLAALFVGAVATYRGVTEAKVLADFGQGGVLIGQKAVDAGLADRVSTFEATLSRLASSQYPPPRTARVAVAPGPVRKAKSTSPLSGSAAFQSASSKGPTMSKPAWLQRFLGGGLAAAAEANEPIDFAAIARMESAANSDALPMTMLTGKLDVTASEEFKAMLLERDALKAERDALKASQSGSIEAQARSFIAQAVADNLILPASAKGMESTYITLAKIDAAEGKTTNVDGYKASILAFPKHNLTREMLAGDLPEGAKAVASDSTGKAPEMSAERERELLSYTPLGDAVLAKQGK